MIFSSNGIRSKNFLLIIILLQIIVCISVFLNIPIIRQIIGFIYLTFVPGLIIVKLLKLHGQDLLQTVLLSVGLSIAFLFIVGLLVNELGFIAGFSAPLSLMPLLIAINGFILVGAIIAFVMDNNIKLAEVKNLSFPSLALFLGLPVLTVIGVICVNVFENNIPLLFVILALSLVFIAGVISKKLIPPKLYPLVIFVIALSLLYSFSLISNYPIGGDIQLEYFIAKNTQNNAYWSSTSPYFGDTHYGRFHSMLSITILPISYSTLLNIDILWVFKIIYPILFSFVPLGLYQIWKKYIGRKFAFISAFFFMAYETFYGEMLGLNRQIIAELFFVLLLLVILDMKKKRFGKMFCFILFSFGLVTSHYGISEIFLVFISITFILLFLFKQPSKNIVLSMIATFFVIMFTWYIFTADSSGFRTFLEFGSNVYNQLGDLFNFASRNPRILMGLGLTSSPTIWNTMSRVFAYATQLLIVIGFFGLITKRVKLREGKEYSIFSYIAMGFLGALIIVPALSDTLNMTRFYHILLSFLAPLCVMGALVIVKFISKRKRDLQVLALLIILLVPYFLFQTSFVYEVTGNESWSVPLSRYRMSTTQLYLTFGYIDSYGVFGAQWLSRSIDVENAQLYSDSYSRYKELLCYGMIYEGFVTPISNTTRVAPNAIIFLGSFAIQSETIIRGRDMWNITEFDFLFNNTNKVYANGRCEVHMTTS